MYFGYKPILDKYLGRVSERREVHLQDTGRSTRTCNPTRPRRQFRRPRATPRPATSWRSTKGTADKLKDWFFIAPGGTEPLHRPPRRGRHRQDHRLRRAVSRRCSRRCRPTRRSARRSASTRRRRSSSTASASPAAGVPPQYFDRLIDLELKTGQVRLTAHGIADYAMTARNSHAGAHQGLSRRLLAPAAVPRARSPVDRGRARRRLRLPRPQRRRQDHHAEAADAAGVSDQRRGGDPRPSGRRRRRQAPHRLPSRKPLLLRSPHGRRTARVLRAAVRHVRGRPAASASRATLDRLGIGAERRLRCASSRRACSSASASRRPCSTIPRCCFSTSRCRASIRWAAATSAR